MLFQVQNFAKIVAAYLHQRFGLSLSAASALIALYAAGGLVYAVLARRIVRRFGERRMVLAGGLLMGAGYLAWWGSPLGWVAGPIALVVGFGAYLFHNTLQTHATQMAPAFLLSQRLVHPAKLFCS